MEVHLSHSALLEDCTINSPFDTMRLCGLYDKVSIREHAIHPNAPVESEDNVKRTYVRFFRRLLYTSLS